LFIVLITSEIFQEKVHTYQTVTSHFSSTNLRDVVDICCRYELQLTQNYKFKTQTLLLTIKLMFKQEMCASQNTPVYINYQTIKNYIHSNGDLDLMTLK
jgi:hypothetical protein